MESNDWVLCTDETYPDFVENSIAISVFSECDGTYRNYLYDSCPFGWNVLCRMKAHWKYIGYPKE